MTAVQAVVRQLSVQQRDGLPKRILDLYEEDERKGFPAGKYGVLQWEHCKELMLSLINANDHTTIVIDALDELDNESQYRQSLLDLLTFLIRECHTVVKVFVSSRDDQDIVKELKNVPN